MARVISLKLLDGDPPVKAPDKWSFSAAKSFADCPKKWFLKQVGLEEFNGPLPPLLGKSALEGTLLHELLKSYSQSPAEFRPRKQLKILIDGQKTRYRNNPRVNIDRLTQRVSIDKILNHFHQFHLRVSALTSRPTPTKDRAKSRKFGAEVYVKDPDSKLFGIIDYIDREGLTDFKTGEKSEDHQEQVLLYGAIWKTQWQETPKQLSVAYDGQPELVKFSSTQLDDILSVWRERINGYDAQISHNNIPANPHFELCSRCSVRPMCQDYWKTIYPAALFSLEVDAYTDFMPTSEATLDKTAVGYYVRDKFQGKDLSLLIDLPGSNASLDLITFRALGLQIRHSEERLQLVANDQAELFSNCPRC